MTHDRKRARWIPACLAVLAVCTPARSGDDVRQKKGTFVRVADPSHVLVSRFHHQCFFGMLGVRPVMSLLASDPLEKEARRFLATLLNDKELTITLEGPREEPGGACSFTGYLEAEDGTRINEELLRRGYASVDDRLPFSRLEAYRALEQEAKAEKRGLWETPAAAAATGGTPVCEEGKIPWAGTCGVSRPEIIPESKVTPWYPRRARRKQIEGRVILRAIVTKEGTTRFEGTESSPDDQLTDAAIAAVEKWRYRPGIRDGEPVDAYFLIVVDFELAGRHP